MTTCKHADLRSIWKIGICYAWCVDCGERWDPVPEEIRQLVRDQAEYILGTGAEGRTATNWRGKRGEA